MHCKPKSFIIQYNLKFTVTKDKKPSKCGLQEEENEKDWRYGQFHNIVKYSSLIMVTPRDECI